MQCFRNRVIHKACGVYSICSMGKMLPSTNGKRAGNRHFLPGLWSLQKVGRLDVCCTFFGRQLWAGEHSCSFPTLSIICHLHSQAVGCVNLQDLKILELTLMHTEPHSGCLTPPKAGAKIKHNFGAAGTKRTKPNTHFLCFSSSCSLLTSTGHRTRVVILSPAPNRLPRRWAEP